MLRQKYSELFHIIFSTTQTSYRKCLTCCNLRLNTSHNTEISKIICHWETVDNVQFVFKS